MCINIYYNIESRRSQLKSFKEYIKEAGLSPYGMNPEDRGRISQIDRQNLSDLFSGKERSGLLKSLERDRMPGNPVIRTDQPATDHKTPVIDPMKPEQSTPAPSIERLHK